MHGHYHGQPFGGYYRYSRGPSRLWWFLLGGAAVAVWNYSRKPEAERRRFSWCRDRYLNGRDDNAGHATRGTRGETSATAAQNAPLEGKMPQGGARSDNGWESEPLWKLRSEKEAERIQRMREVEVREQLLGAREQVLSVTESGLESLRQSLDALTRMVQDQRRESSPRERPPTAEGDKKD